MKILNLTLNKPPFDVMLSGEKTLEYREPTAWIMSRLFDKNGNKKEYDAVKFTNGYGSDRPYFIAEFKGWVYWELNAGIIKYTNFDLVLTDGYYVIIELGKIIESGNLK
jgi:hypothetical protein